MAKREKISQKRLRKIRHLEDCLNTGMSKAEARKKALHFMKMPSEDVQRAFGGNIYEE